mmetsp:Transcript_42252/g.126425  ORF Transcript_42252/g.126425 Transcript_42252/m.126425 type:complete len:530 (-) Transcript_42252:38-1627(-)
MMGSSVMAAAAPPSMDSGTQRDLLYGCHTHGRRRRAGHETSRPCAAGSHGGLLLALLRGLLVRGAGGSEPAGQQPMEVRIFAPQHVLDTRWPNDAWPTIRHPWAIRDVSAEADLKEDAKVPLPVTRDGIEVEVSLVDGLLPAGAEAALYVGLFSFSLTGSEATVEQWMAEGNLPPPHNPIRLWTLFSHQYTDGLMQPDELGDVCLGEAFRAEFCCRVATCFRVSAPRGGGRWRLAVPVQWATNYRLEAYLGEATSACLERPSGQEGAAGRSVWWAPPVAEHAVPSRSGVARYAAFTRFRLLFVNKAGWWWGQHAQVEPVTSWTEMMAAAVDAAVRSPAANPGQHGLPVPASKPHGIWLEFGVGSGKSTAAIAVRLKARLGPQAVLHGFDSFRGLPTSWAHTKLGAGTFSTGGVIPEHLARMENVRVHVGLFSETLQDLDEFGPTPVAFAHVDVDLYASAVEVLSKIACQLYPGSILVFDEIVNYIGFEISGEYRAWEYVSSLYQIAWDYAGLFWQQAVPVVVMERGRVC